MKARDIDFLLIGGGFASVAAAETLRFEGAQGSILILSDEDQAPYRRPSLSKRYLLGAVDGEQILLHPASFYREHAIELQLNARVVAVDPAQQLVTTASGEQVRYGRLLIATGAAPERLSVPGASLDGVYSLRRKADCDAIRLAAGQAKRAVVLGGNFIGMEIAMALIELGLGVTIVERSAEVLERLSFDPPDDATSPEHLS